MTLFLVLSSNSASNPGPVQQGIWLVNFCFYSSFIGRYSDSHISFPGARKQTRLGLRCLFPDLYLVRKWIFCVSIGCGNSIEMVPKVHGTRGLGLQSAVSIRMLQCPLQLVCMQEQTVCRIEVNVSPSRTEEKKFKPSQLELANVSFLFSTIFLWQRQLKDPER